MNIDPTSITGNIDGVAYTTGDLVVIGDRRGVYGNQRTVAVVEMLIWVDNTRTSIVDAEFFTGEFYVDAEDVVSVVMTDNV